MPTGSSAESNVSPDVAYVSTALTKRTVIESTLLVWPELNSVHQDMPLPPECWNGVLLGWYGVGERGLYLFINNLALSRVVSRAR